MLRTVAAMVGVITAVLAGSTAGLAAAVASPVLAAVLASGVIVALAVLAALVRYQFSASDRAKQAALLTATSTRGNDVRRCRLPTRRP